MTPHAVFPISESSQVGEARRHAASLTEAAAFDTVAAGRVALVVTELGNNLARHAQGGKLLIALRRGDDGAVLEVLSMDTGPGIRDVAACMADGYSSNGTPGTGLGAVRRLSTYFEVHSLVGSGTLIAACIPAGAASRRSEAPAFDAAGICTAIQHETVSGDGWLFQQQGDSAAVMVADGLGHGPDAAAASDAALHTFGKKPYDAPSATMQSAHGALRSLRGAAVATAVLNRTGASITFCGIGNIAGRIVSGVEDRSLLSQHGTVGLQMRQPQDVSYPWPEHALLILHSDGIVTRWNFDNVPGLLACGPLIIAAWLIRDHSRGRDDATVVVVRRH